MYGTHLEDKKICIEIGVDRKNRGLQAEYILMLYASVQKYNDIAAHLCNRVVDFYSCVKKRKRASKTLENLKKIERLRIQVLTRNLKYIRLKQGELILAAFDTK